MCGGNGYVEFVRISGRAFSDLPSTFGLDDMVHIKLRFKFYTAHSGPGFKRIQGRFEVGTGFSSLGQTLRVKKSRAHSIKGKQSISLPSRCLPISPKTETQSEGGTGLKI